MPQRAHALRVAPIFGPRYVAKLARSTAATLYAWLLAIFRKFTATWHTWVSQQSPSIVISRFGAGFALEIDSLKGADHGYAAGGAPLIRRDFPS